MYYKTAKPFLEIFIIPYLLWFVYIAADTILANWKNSNVSSLEDVKKADAAYAAGNNIKPKQTASSKPANNRFNNFQQRDKKSDDWYNSLLSNNN